MTADTTLSTLRLLTSGPVPGWAGVLLFIAASWLVLWQLRRDLASLKRTRLTRWGLPLLRLAIVGVISWLLCQPMLLIERHWTPPAQVMLVVDSGNSMRVNEAGGELSPQLDALQAVGKQPIAKRNNAASRMARACEAISRESASTLAALREDQDAATTGLPLGPSVARKADTLGADLRHLDDAMISARAELPADVADKELKRLLADLAAAAQVVGANAQAIIADGAVVTREAAKSPALLDAYLDRLKGLAGEANSVGQRAMDVQEKLDKALLTPKELEDLRAKPLTRETLAEMAADWLSAQGVSAMVHTGNEPEARARIGDGDPGESGSSPEARPRREPYSEGSGQQPSFDRIRSPALSTALEDAFHKSLVSPLAGVVLLSDGSSPLPPAGSSLDRLTLPVSTVLIGADGVEPADAGLVAIDVPRIALAGDAVTVRCLVKNLVTGTPSPKLMLTVGKEQVAARDLSVTRDGYDVVELSWTPAAPGRTQLLFNIATAHTDAYPGNESSAAIVDVISNKAHVLVVSDRLTGDFAAISQLLAAMPAVDSHAILAAPGLSKFHTGSKLDEFPATPDDFKALSLLVLIGDVPEAAGDEVIRSLRTAIDAGLRVWVQSSAPGRSVKPWSTALGIKTKPIDGRRSIEPSGDLWLDLYQLGRDRDESDSAWRALPQVGGLSEIVTPGIPLLAADNRPVLQLIPRKAGAVIISGISDFTALRSASTSGSVNRLLNESLALGLTPIAEPGQTAGIFAPQPILDRGIYVIGEASNPKGLELAGGAATAVGAKAFRVTDPQSISLQIGGATLERKVRHLLTRADFQLAAHAAPLEKIAAATGGRHRDLLSLTDVLPQGLTGTPRSSATRIPLWPGAWSLFVLLALVSTEYLLRRRAGKVM